MECYFNTLKDNQCHELCESGKCNADCCGCVSFLESYFKKLKKLIPSSTEYQLFKYNENGYTYVKPLTRNLKCVFLSDSNYCIIHDSHLLPEYCKRFGADKSEPLYACKHINQEFIKEIDEFSKVYLQGQANNGNVMAKYILNAQETPKNS